MIGGLNYDCSLTILGKHNSFGRTDVNIGKSAWKAHSVTWKLGSDTQYALRPRKTTDNLGRRGMKSYMTSNQLMQLFWCSYETREHTVFYNTERLWLLKQVVRIFSILNDRIHFDARPRRVLCFILWPSYPCANWILAGLKSSCKVTSKCLAWTPLSVRWFRERNMWAGRHELSVMLPPYECCVHKACLFVSLTRYYEICMTESPITDFDLQILVILKWNCMR